MTYREYICAKKKATALLSHYFALLFEKADLEWTEDNEAEMEDLVGAIVDTVRATIQVRWR